MGFFSLFQLIHKTHPITKISNKYTYDKLVFNYLPHIAYAPTGKKRKEIIFQLKTRTYSITVGENGYF
jgi:hypothetical protein